MVSIIIPYHNRPLKLSRTLDSVYAQSYKDIEVIVVDDCSDETPDLTNYPDVVLLVNETNLGPGMSRNKGFQQSKGEYICFLDSDDYWAPDFLSSMLELHSKNPDACMAYSNGIIVGYDGQKLGKYCEENFQREAILPHLLTKGRPWGTGGCVWKRTVIEDVNWISTRTWEDYAFDVTVAQSCNVIASLDKELVYYESHGEDKLSKETDDFMQQERSKSVLEIERILRKKEFLDDPLYRKLMALMLMSNIIGHLASGGPARRLAWQNARALGTWWGFIGMIWVYFLIGLPLKAGLPLLRKYRKAIQKIPPYIFRTEEAIMKNA